MFNAGMNMEETEGKHIETQGDFLCCLHSMEEELTRLAVAIHHSPDSWELLSEKLDRLCEFIVCEENEKRWRQGSNCEEVKQCSARIRERSAHALCIIEKMRALRTYTEAWDANLYFTLLSAAVQEEWGYTRINRESKVIFIGAGAFPMSALTIAMETSAEVLCTDIDEEAVRHGRKLASFLGLHGSFHYTDSHMRDREFLREATHVFIASLVPEKLEILDELSSEVHPDCKIIVRYGNGLRSLFNYPLDIRSLKEWRVTPVSRHNCIYETLILELQKSAARSAI